MANSPQAIKRARQQVKRRLHNASQRSAMRTAVKQVYSAISANNTDQAQTAYKNAVVSLDRLAGRQLIHPNKAARLKSRLNKKLKKQ